jgi:hypothetical protein
MWIVKALFSPYRVRFIRFVVKPLIMGSLCVKLDGILKEFGDKSGDLRTLGTSQRDMGKEWMALEGFHDGHNSVMTTDTQVVALGNVVSEDDSGALADSREDGQENPAFEGLGFVDDHK